MQFAEKKVIKWAHNLRDTIIQPSPPHFKYVHFAPTCHYSHNFSKQLVQLMAIFLECREATNTSLLSAIGQKR